MWYYDNYTVMQIVFPTRTADITFEGKLRRKMFTCRVGNSIFRSRTSTVCGNQLTAFNQTVGGTMKSLKRGENAVNRAPDVEAIFEFNGTRKNPAIDGYRPAHLINDNYLTTGIHHYYRVNAVPPNGSAKGTITFLSPEAYPHCLYIGKKINIQEGDHIVGYATITKIFNPLLCLEGRV